MHSPAVRLAVKEFLELLCPPDVIFSNGFTMNDGDLNFQAINYSESKPYWEEP